MTIKILINIGGIENPVCKVFADGTNIENIKQFIKEWFPYYIYSISYDYLDNSYLPFPQNTIQFTIGYDDMGEYCEDKNYYLLTEEVDGI